MRLIFLVIFVLFCLIQPVYPAEKLTMEQIDLAVKLITEQVNYLDRLTHTLGEKRTLLVLQLQSLQREQADRKLQDSHKKSLEGTAKDSEKGDGKPGK